MKRKSVWLTVSCLVVVALVMTSCTQMPSSSPVSGGLGKSLENAVPLGTPLAVAVYRGVQELTVLRAECQEYRTTGGEKLSVEVRIRAIQDTEYFRWDFKAFGSNGVLYECQGIPLRTQIVAGTSRVEEFIFFTEEGDRGEFFLVWDASLTSGIDRRYFSLQ